MHHTAPKTIFSISFFILLSLSSLAQKFTLNGFVKDSLTGETLIGASLSISSSTKGVATNAYGFYSITLDKGRYIVACSFVGYQSKAVEVNLDSNIQYNFQLLPSSFVSNNVTITGRRPDQNVKSTQLGRVDLSIEKVKQIPAFMGEVDILKALQFLPGVRNAGEGNTGLYVRGGGADQNLIILDDAVVYNSGHLFGFFSVFNGDAIKNVSLIKGGMPAQYGGRLSSVVDVTMKDGDNQKYEVEGGIGAIASRLSVQGPIQKDKSSFIIAARRTYIDALITPFTKTTNLAGSGYYFYDANMKMNFRLSQKDRLYASGYFGRDVFTFKNKERSFNTTIPWGNTTATLRWNHIFNRRLFTNTTLVYNDYNFKFEGGQNDFRFVLSSGIKDINAKMDADFFPAPEHKVKFGAQYTYHTFLPNQFSGKQDTTIFLPNTAARKYASETAFYIQDDWELSDKLKINAGLRWGSFTQLGQYTAYTKDEFGNRTDSTVYGKGAKVKTYSGFEPRLSFRYAFNDRNSVKAGITRNLQYIHLSTNSGTTLPTDLWVPSTLRVQPQIGWQYAAGYFKNFNDNMYETSVELYYKTMQHQVEYREGFTPSFNDPEEDFVFGKGWSYGAEFFVNKTRGKLTGWLGYTLSWTWRQFAQINQGNKFPTKYDRRHDMSVVANYDLNKRWRFGAAFVFGTGNATTYPERFYLVNGIITQEFGVINSYRVPAYHRLDVSATLTPKRSEHKKLKGSWVFSIYNVYSRKNPYFIYFDQEGDPAQGTQKIKAIQVSLFPILPSVTWNFKF
jgi:outer membrane receptor protein involved in Fe transport